MQRFNHIIIKYSACQKNVINKIKTQTTKSETYTIYEKRLNISNIQKMLKINNRGQTLQWKNK